MKRKDEEEQGGEPGTGDGTNHSYSGGSGRKIMSLRTAWAGQGETRERRLHPLKHSDFGYNKTQIP